ncbi:hypothetical protein BpHYR1_006258 [Brachionus plicatilis]|uniref:Uncharacterized protein n=1 Tax=Brachionus plicatilis TaxID=10195 RepID=A0A3M7QUL2_BRAPC|nr:hypothetical protein BpHYR1_006258 [Brachionus plicatilis]
MILYLFSLLPLIVVSKICTIGPQSLNCLVNFTINMNFIDLIKIMSANVSVIVIDFNHSVYSQSKISNQNDLLWTKTVSIRNVARFEIENGAPFFFTYFSAVKVVKSKIEFYYKNKSTSSLDVCNGKNLALSFFYSTGQYSSISFSSDNIYPSEICPYAFMHSHLHYVELRNLNLTNFLRIVSVHEHIDMTLGAIRILDSVIRWEPSILNKGFGSDIFSLEILNSTLYNFRKVKSSQLRLLVLNLVNMKELLTNASLD